MRKAYWWAFDLSDENTSPLGFPFFFGNKQVLLCIGHVGRRTWDPELEQSYHHSEPSLMMPNEL